MPVDPVLIIDDEEDIRNLIALSLKRRGIPSVLAGTLAQARDHIAQNTKFSLCISDVRLPDGSGIDLITVFRDKFPRSPVVVITAYGSTDMAVEAMRAGAFDFIGKPVRNEKLTTVIEHALSEQNETPIDADQLMGSSKAMRKLRTKIGKVARTQAPVLICGDSGTGKELVARAIHRNSHLKDNPFIPVNCGAIPTELMESEFFGHIKGSFTGATTDKTGLFQSAQGGTLFLDEIADLPLHMQVKLLRALQAKAVRPVGSDKEIATDVRILSATNKDLEEELKEGRFRQDLYYRINVIDIDIPPLRERLDDLPELCNKILADQPIPDGGLAYHLTGPGLEHLRKYHFPGNVRELENILQRAAALCEDGLIGPDDLNLKIVENDPSLENSQPEPQLTTTSEPTSIASLEDHIGQMEKEILEKILIEEKWNRSASAKRLGLTLRQIRYKLAKHGLDQ